MNNKPRLLAVAVTAALSLPHFAFAADTLDDGKAAKTLDTVQVRGQREPKKSSNHNVTTLHAGQLEDQQAESMEDLVRYIPGVSVSDLGRFGDNGFNIRGIEGNRVAMTIDGLSMAEGLETARAYEFFRAGRGGVDTSALKSVEVVKGADSITAGSGALGGAVMFTTKDPHDYLELSGNDTYLGGKLGYTGHNAEALGTLTLANRSGIVESMLVYTRRHASESEGWYRSTAVATGSARRLPDPIEHDSTHLLAKLDFVISNAQRLGLVYERNRVDNLVENLSRVSPPSYLERWGDDHNARDRYGLVYHWHADNIAFDDLELRLDRQATESRGITRIVTGSRSSANPVPTPNTTPCTPTQPCHRAEDRVTQQTLDKLALDFGKKSGPQQLRYGASWQNRSVDFSAIDYRWNNRGELDTATVDPAQVPGTDVAAWNLYLSDRITLRDERLQLHAGARYDRYDYSPTLSPTFQDPSGTVRAISFAAPSWQAGVSYAFVPQQSLWLQAGRGFRAPTTGELYAPTSTTEITEVATGAVITVPSVVANPALAAERSLNLEAGYRWQTDNLMFGISLFRDRYSDFIDTLRTTVNPTIEYQTCARGQCSTRFGYDYSTTANIGRATIKGVELEAHWRLGQAWQLRTAWSHNQGQQADGRPLDSINPDRGVLGLSWQNAEGRLRLTGNLTHAAAKRISDVNVGTDIFGQPEQPFLSDRYTVLDVFGSFQMSDHLRINAGLYNVFDTRYYQWARIRNVTRGDFYLYGYATDDGIGRFSEPGRNLRVSVSFNF